MMLAATQLAELTDRILVLLRECSEEEAETVVRVAIGRLRKERRDVIKTETGKG